MILGMDSSDVTSRTNTRDPINIGEDETSHGAFVDLGLVCFGVKCLLKNVFGIF
jgi:hypothetical protein